VIYDKPTKVLMRQFAEECLKPGQIFERRDAVKWFEAKYPNIKSNTVELHVEGMSVNNGGFRKHHKQIKSSESGYDLFYKLGNGKYRLWDPTSDQAPWYNGDQLIEDSKNQALPEIGESNDSDADGSSKEFAFERDLNNYLAKNLESLEKGLKLYQVEGFDGIEFPAGGGRRSDILAVDAQGEFVVVELKVSRGYDRTVGQILRYMGWVKANLAEGKAVHGIIVASDITEDLKLAASQIPGVRLVEYEISFKLKPL
jgi:hypothetical protein